MTTFTLHSSHDNLRFIAQRWLREMGNEFKVDKSLELIYHKLLMLGDNPTVEEIEAIVGNDTWTTERCSACHQSVDRWIEFTNLNLVTHTLCEPCVSRMHAIFKGEPC